jgi:hypothetical protein
VRGLAAERTGDTVTLRFTIPQRSTDDLPLRDKALVPVLCRADHGGGCVPLSPGAPIPVQGQHGVANSATLTDTLPTSVSTGPLRSMEYRVELLNSRGKTAGFSQPATTAAGEAPDAVTGFAVKATRLGNLLSWDGASGDSKSVFVSRQSLAKPVAARPGEAASPSAFVLLRADSTDAEPNAGQMLDTSAVDGVPYRYIAFRERTLTLAGHAVTMRSADSSPIDFTLRDVFPPPVPTGLTAAGFMNEATAKQPAVFAVDLIWQPVDDPGLSGYNLYRQPVNEGASARVRLNKTPLPSPAFHDTTAKDGVGYLYSVTAVDRKGNESAPATTQLVP